MRRGVIETLRRGLDNTLANWPLIAIRLGEALLFVLLAILAGLVVIVPILVSVGVELSRISTPDDIQQAAFSLLEKWTLLLWIGAALLVLALIFVLLHAFVEAGCARVAVDAERAAGPSVEGPRARFRVFSMERWMAGARSGGWTVFWIYNLAWSVAGLILLLPLLPTLIVTLVFREEPAIAATGGCIGLLLTMLLAIVVGIITSIWTNRAIAEWAAKGSGATRSLALARSAFRADLGRHLLIALAMVVIALAGSSFFASFSFLGTFGRLMNDQTIFHLISIPMRLAGSFFSMIFSALMSGWALAAYSALAVEEKP